VSAVEDTVRRRPGREAWALGAAILAASLTAIGTFRGNDDHQLRAYLVVLAIIVVATAVIFWVIVPRITDATRGALILAVLAVISVVLFWLGLPALFAGAAAYLAASTRSSRETTVARVIAALAVAAAVVLAFAG
jgi:heme/copper-type cytochrome/quinol oxidase subunit 4